MSIKINFYWKPLVVLPQNPADVRQTEADGLIDWHDYNKIALEQQRTGKPPYLLQEPILDLSYSLAWVHFDFSSPQYNDCDVKFKA